VVAKPLVSAGMVATIWRAPFFSGELSALVAVVLRLLVVRLAIG
jgi:ABC-type uncharacterized transport system permease subunit